MEALRDYEFIRKLLEYHTGGSATDVLVNVPTFFTRFAVIEVGSLLQYTVGFLAAST